MHFDEAVRAAGYEHHSDFRIDKLFEEAPYYGEILDHEKTPCFQGVGRVSADERTRSNRNEAPRAARGLPGGAALRAVAPKVFLPWPS